MGELLGQLPRPEGYRLAWRRTDGRGPTVVWLGGFRSDMSGTKAQALADWAARSRRAFLRFDYSGHGESGGDFAEGTIGRWRDDALAAVDKLAPGPVILVGSSMGGWIACLLALARPDRVQGLVLIAPAADFTEALMWPGLSDEARAAIEADGFWMQPSEYGPPYPITRAMIEDGRRWSILPGPVRITAPVRVLQGAQDPDVPWEHALKLAQALEAEDVAFTLIKAGDHRLSTPADLQRLTAAVEELAAMADSPSR
jgi:pimeloyl-ACP methyl ester carboxylesterase